MHPMTDAIMLKSWAVFCLIGTATFVTDLMDAGKAGGTFGAQAILFMAVIFSTSVIIYLFKKMDKSTTDRFEQLLDHHTQSINTFNAERAATMAQRSEEKNMLLDVVRSNTAMITKLTTIIEERVHNK